MRYLFILMLITFCALLGAQQMQMTTPGGNINVNISGMQNYSNIPYTTSGDVIEQINARLSTLEKTVHNKLSKQDQRKAANLTKEIYGLLGMLPTDDMLNQSKLTTQSEATHTTVTTNPNNNNQGNNQNNNNNDNNTNVNNNPNNGTYPNININISGINPEPKPIKDKPKPQPQLKPVPNPTPQPTPQPVPQAAPKKPMPDADFNTLVGRINNEKFSDGKIRVLRTAAKNTNFSVNQIIRLINANVYSEDKLEALRIAYPVVTDPQNNYLILDAFTYESDKEEADKIINQ